MPPDSLNGRNYEKHSKAQFGTIVAKIIIKDKILLKLQK
jgi:hypothetical protein